MTILSVTAASANYYNTSAPASPVSVAQALSQLSANPRLKLSISDSTANIQNNIDQLYQFKNNLTGLEQSDPSTNLSLSMSEFNKVSGLLQKMSTAYQVDVTAAATSNISSLNSNAHVNSFAISDTTSNIVSNFALLNNSARLSSFTIKDSQNLLQLSNAQFASSSDLLGKAVGPMGLSITGASASDALSYSTDSRVKSVSVSDTVTNIHDSLDQFNTLGLKLKQIQATDGNQFEVTANQIQSDAFAIGKLYRGYQLTVDNATLAQASALTSNKSVVSLNVVDTAANVSNQIDLLNNLGNKISSISLSDGSTNSLSMTSAQYYASTATLGKIINPDSTGLNPAFKVAIQAASVSDAQAFTSSNNITSISVADSGKAISSALNQLIANKKIIGIKETGSSTPLSVNYSDLFSSTTNSLTSDAQSFLSRFPNGYSLNVSGVPVNQAAGLLSNLPNIQSISVTGSTSEITSQLPALASIGKVLQNIQLQDPTTPLAISVSQWSKNIGVLAKIQGGYSLALSNVSAANASKFVLDPHVASVSVNDTSAAIAANFDNLNALGSQLTALNSSDAAPLAITGQQWGNDKTALNLMGSGIKLAIKNASATQITALANDTKVVSANIADTGANISNNLDKIQAAVSQTNAPVISINQTDKSTIAITANQYKNDSSALNALSNPYTLNVSDVLTADSAAVGQNAHVVGMSISTNSTDFSSNLAQFNALGNKLTAISFTDPNTLVSISATQWSSYQSVLAKVNSGPQFSVTGASASQAPTLSRDTRISALTVADTGAHIASNLDKLQALGSQLQAIQQTDTGNIIVSMSQYANDADVITKLEASGATLAITGATVSQVLAMNDTKVKSFQIVDSSANVAANLDSLQALQSKGQLSGITLNGIPQPLVITKAQLVTDAGTLSLIQGGYKASISDAAMSDVSALAANSHVFNMNVVLGTSDIASSGLGGNLSILKTAGSKVSSIQFNATIGTSPVLSMTSSQWIADQNVLAKISANYSVGLTNVLAANAQLLAQDARVKSIGVADTASNIQSNLTNLESLGSQLASISPSPAGTTLNLSLTANQYAAAGSIFSALTQGNTSYALSITNATADQAKALSQNSKVISIGVRDSTDNIASHITELASNADLKQIQLTDPTNPFTITGAQYASVPVSNTLGLISGNYALNVTDAVISSANTLQNDSHVASFSLADAASAINTNLTALSSMSKLTGITVNANDSPITISQSQLASDTSILNQLQGPYSLNVTGSTLTDLSTTLQLSNLNSVSVTDYAQNISQNFDQLVQIGNTLSAISVKDPNTNIAITEIQYQAGSAALATMQGSYGLAILNAAAPDAATLASDASIKSISVADSAAEITNNLATLTTLASGTQLDSIAVTDSKPLFLTQAQQNSYKAALDKILGPVNVVTTTGN